MEANIGNQEIEIKQNLIMIINIIFKKLGPKFKIQILKKWI